MLCAATGKQRHADKKKAALHLLDLRRRSGYGGKVYRCPHCGGWHVGRGRGPAFAKKRTQ